MCEDVTEILVIRDSLFHNCHIPDPHSTDETDIYTCSCSSPSILQPSILRPPLIIRLLDLVLKGNFLLNDFYFKTTCNIRAHFLGPMGGLKIEGCKDHP